MRELTRGQRLKLADLVDPASPFTIRIQATAPFAVDCACFGLDRHGRLAGDPYLIFYNQLATPCTGVRLSLSSHTADFLIHLDALPAAIERLVLTATVDGVGDMSGLQHGSVEVYQHDVRHGCAELHGGDFQGEKALLLTEVYRKDGVWRCAVLGTGFHGGLSALLRHFGGEEAPPVPVPATPIASVSLSKAVRLEKELRQAAPQLVSLVKAAHARLDHHGLSEHVAKVCLVLDVSGSMIGLYPSHYTHLFLI